MRVAAASGIDSHEGPERTREMGFGHALAMIAHAQAVTPVWRDVAMQSGAAP
jgi:hypothetical protein